MIIGVIHLLPLPGSLHYKDNLNEVITDARTQCAIYNEAGFDAVIFENFNDYPFHKEGSKAAVAAMSYVVSLCQNMLTIPFGINILRNDGPGAHSVATVTGADFIRVNMLTYAAVADQGIIEGCAAAIADQKQVFGKNIKIFADVGVKHATSLAPSLEQEALDATKRGGAEALIVSGTQTGSPPDLEHIKLVKNICNVPVYIGSGASLSNIKQLLSVADGVIVASALKKDNKLDLDAAKKFVKEARKHL